MTQTFCPPNEKKGADETYQLDGKVHLKQNSQDLQLSIAEEGQSVDSQLTQQKDRIALNPPLLCIFTMKKIEDSVLLYNFIMQLELFFLCTTIFLNCFKCQTIGYPVSSGNGNSPEKPVRVLTMSPHSAIPKGAIRIRS